MIRNYFSATHRNFNRTLFQPAYFPKKVPFRSLNTKAQTLPIGYDNFRSVIEENLLFVDKSLLIKEFIDNKGNQVTLLPRPRRFGKSLNLSMLQHFFANKVNGKPTKDLFNGLKITEAGEDYMAHQGQYPVVYLSFKDIKSRHYHEAVNELKYLLRDVYQKHIELLNSPHLTKNQKEDFEAVLTRQMDDTQLKRALVDLTEYLHNHYDKKVILLIDEYDTPLQTGYMHGYYNEITEIMRHLLSSSLKTNDYLYRAVLTGVMRIAKESIFTGLNNLSVYSLFSDRYGEYFGFTEKEVTVLAEQTGLLDKMEAMKQWYNGYQIANTTLYNPWSIANCIQKGGNLGRYWVNTSDNTLIKELLINSSNDFKKEFEVLLSGGSVQCFISEDFVFNDLKNKESLIWSLFLITGYLKVVKFQEEERGLYCTLAVPNQEVGALYRTLIEEWLAQDKGLVWYDNFLKSLLKGDMINFEEGLKTIMSHTVSVHDVARAPEAFYHGLLLGLIVSLDRKAYEVKSNRESGGGRYDIAIIPKNTEELGLLIELKKIDLKEKNLNAELEKSSQSALKQIDEKQYLAEFEQRGMNKVLKIGLAFSGKDFHLTHETTQLNKIEQVASVSMKP